MIKDQPTCSVLFVEDNDSDFLLVSRLLQKRKAVTLGGFHFVVERAGTLAEAREKISRGRYDCVLLDAVLPDTTNLQGLVKLREQFPYLPIVMVTGLRQDFIALRALSEGAQDFVSKDRMSVKELVTAVRYAVTKGVRALQGNGEESSVALEHLRKLQLELVEAG